MELHERIAGDRRPAREQEPFAELKNRIHMSVISELGPQLFNISIDPNELRDRVTADIRRLLNDEAGIAREDRERLTSEILDDILGYGPIEPFLRDETVTEVMVNKHDVVYVERDSQKGIVIGQAGRTIKALGQAARARTEALLGRPVFLELRVKVLPRWRHDPSALRRLGYTA